MRKTRRKSSTEKTQYTPLGSSSDSIQHVGPQRPALGAARGIGHHRQERGQQPEKQDQAGKNKERRSRKAVTAGTKNLKQ